MIYVLIFSLMLSGIIITDVSAQNSIFDQKFSDVKFLDAYFGTTIEKIEVSPGDTNVPFTILFANVGTIDITGIKGVLSTHSHFSPSGTIQFTADQTSNPLAGDTFSLTFFVDISEYANIVSYPGSVQLEYSRIRESGTRTSSISFDFRITGEGILEVSTPDLFLSSLENNNVTIIINNSGTAIASGIEVELQNTQTESSTMTNLENVVISNTYWNLGDLAPDSSREFLVQVYVPSSIKDQTFRAPLLISYVNAHGDLKEIVRAVDFFIHGKQDLSIYDLQIIKLSDQPTLIGEIINEGNEDALFGFVTIQPLGNSQLQESTIFIDEIEVDSPTPFNIPLKFEGDFQEGDHDIKIIVRYKDNMRSEYFVTELTTITLQPLQNTSDDQQGNLIWIIILVIIAAGILLLIRKKRPSCSILHLNKK